MAEQSRLELVIEAKNATKRALAGAKRGIKGFAASARQGFARIRKAVFSVRGAMTALAGAGAITALGKKVFDLGSQVEETANRFRTVFGPAVEEVNGFLDEFAAKAGLSRSEAEDAASSAGGLAQGFGFAQEESAELSQQILKLAGDFTSFHDVPIERTLNAITSAMAGEREQLKQLDVVLRQTEVDQRALAETGKASADALTQQERATATLSLITEKAGVVIGDLNRTQDSAANRARRVAAEFRTLKETIARALLPVVEEALNLLDRIDFVRFAAAVQTDIGQAFLNLGILAGARMGQGIFTGLEKVLRESFVLAKIPGPVGDFFDKINVAAAGVGEVAEIAKDSAADASEAIDILAESGGNLEGLTAQLEKARERLDRARQGGGGGGGGDGFSPSPVSLPGGGGPVGEIGGTVAQPGQAPLGLGPSGQGFSVQELKDFARMASEGVDVSPVRKLLSGWQQVGFEIAKVTENQRTMQRVMADITTQTIQGFTQAFQAAAKAAVTGSKSMGQAFKGAMLGALAQVAAAMSKFYAAKAAAALGEGLMGNPAAFGAAAKFTAAAAAFGALAGVLQGVASGGGGGAAGAARSGAQGTRDTLDRERGKTIINIEGGILDMSDPRQQRALERAFEDVSDRRVIIT